MDYKCFSNLVSTHARPIILLEGTRQLPDFDQPKLVAFARQLATKFPHAYFRTGNASGSDEAFAAGIMDVDPQRLEYVLPYRTMRQRSRHKVSPSLSLDEVSDVMQELLASETLKASPKYRSLVEGRTKHSALKIKANYLLRDTLKITGFEEADFHPAQIGVFYVNTEKPSEGGTGHTIRVCENRQIPVIIQDVWMQWILEK
jgi:hypothetical protein